MGIALGNLSLSQMQERLGITLTKEDILRFPPRQENVSIPIAADSWHCFDIPFVLQCGSMATARAIFDILSPYSGKVKCPMQIALDERNGEQHD